MSPIGVLTALGLGAGSAMVDLGAGTSPFTLTAAAVATRVVAVDVSPVLLQILRARMESHGISTVDIVQAGFLSYQHRGDPLPALPSDSSNVRAVSRVRVCLPDP